MSVILCRSRPIAGLIVGLALALVPLQANAAQVATCTYSGTHYWSRAWSNAGSNKGTGAEMDTWTHWSLGGQPSNGNPPPFSNEAVWTINGTGINSATEDAFEVGFKTGGNVLGTFSNGMYPYYTENDGACPCNYFTGTSLPASQVIWNSATSDGTHSWAYVNNKLIAEVNYGVSTPRLNYEQAEVDYHNIWMGGGSGSNIALEYQTPANKWFDWGVISGDTQPSSAAGYGYFNQTQQPNGVTEGGYGKACT